MSNKKDLTILLLISTALTLYFTNFCTLELTNYLSLRRLNHGGKDRLLCPARGVHKYAFEIKANKMAYDKKLMEYNLK